MTWTACNQRRRRKREGLVDNLRSPGRIQASQAVGVVYRQSGQSGQSRQH